MTLPMAYQTSCLDVGIVTPHTRLGQLGVHKRELSLRSTRRRAYLTALLVSNSSRPCFRSSKSKTWHRSLEPHSPAALSARDHPTVHTKPINAHHSSHTSIPPSSSSPTQKFLRYSPLHATSTTAQPPPTPTSPTPHPTSPAPSSTTPQHHLGNPPPSSPPTPRLFPWQHAPHPTDPASATGLSNTSAQPAPNQWPTPQQHAHLPPTHLPHQPQTLHLLPQLPIPPPPAASSLGHDPRIGEHPNSTRSRRQRGTETGTGRGLVVGLQPGGGLPVRPEEPPLNLDGQTVRQSNGQCPEAPAATSSRPHDAMTNRRFHFTVQKQEFRQRQQGGDGPDRTRDLRRFNAAQLTAALAASPSVEHLMVILASWGAAGIGWRSAVAVAVESKSRTATRQPRFLRSEQLCAALTAAERIASTVGASGTATDASVPHRQRPTGLLAPPCQPLSYNTSTALTGLLAAHAEVLADAPPGEMAVTLWAAARLQLRLSYGTLAPALEALWMWEPADPTLNAAPPPRAAGNTRVAALSQPATAAAIADGRSDEGATNGIGSSGDGTRVANAGMGGGGSRSRDSSGRQRGSTEMMRLRELCLMLYAVSVLVPEYLRRHAGGFVEALDSYEVAGGEGRRQGGGGGAGGGVGLGRSRGLELEQVVGMVAAFARAGVKLDEEGEEFVLQAVSCRLRAFSFPQLTSLLSAARSWRPLSGPLHMPLLATMLQRLEAEDVRHRTQLRRTKDLMLPSEVSTPAFTSPERQDSAAAASITGGSHDVTSPTVSHSPPSPTDASAPQQTPAPHQQAAAIATGSPTATTAAASRPSNAAADAAVGRALSTALSACVHPITGALRVPGPVVSGLLRQVRYRSRALNGRDVCEALRAMAAVPVRQRKVVAAWNEGLRALLLHWTSDVLAASSSSSSVVVVVGVTSSAAGTGGDRSEPPSLSASAAHTFAATLHAVRRLGVKLQASESAAVGAAVARLAPYMTSLADCCMVLTALAWGVVTGPGAGVEEEDPLATVGPPDGDGVAHGIDSSSDNEVGSAFCTSAAAAAASTVEAPVFEAGSGVGVKSDSKLGLDDGSTTPLHARGWRYLTPTNPQQITLNATCRTATLRVLQQAAVLLQRHGPDAASRVSSASAGDVSGRAVIPRVRCAPGEMVCLVRSAAAAGLKPGSDWWMGWEVAAWAVLPPWLRRRLMYTAGTSSGGGGADGARPSKGRQEDATASGVLSAAEAADVLYNLSRLTYVRRQRRQQMGRSERSVAVRIRVGPRRRGPSTALRTTPPVLPIRRALPTGLLAVACLLPPPPVQRTVDDVTARRPRTSRHGGGGRSQGRVKPAVLLGDVDDRVPSSSHLSPMSTYYLAWAVAQLRLVQPGEVRLWAPCLAAASPGAFSRLTPRKQVLMLRCLTIAFRTASLPLPPAVTDAWLTAFAGSLERAGGTTLSYAAVAVAAARMKPTAAWMARFCAAVRQRADELRVKEVAALVAALRLHRHRQVAPPLLPPPSPAASNSPQQPVMVPPGAAPRSTLSRLEPNHQLSFTAQPLDRVAHTHDGSTDELAWALLRALRRKLSATSTGAVAAAAATTPTVVPSSPAGASETATGALGCSRSKALSHPPPSLNTARSSGSSSSSTRNTTNPHAHSVLSNLERLTACRLCVLLAGVVTKPTTSPPTTAPPAGFFAHSYHRVD